MMRFVLVGMLIAITLIALPPERVAWAHDCPLQQMGRLETFRDLDQDKDGRLNLEEFMAQRWCQEVPSCQCQEVARQFFQKVDQNRDGFITLEEHQAFARERQRLGK